MKKIGIISLCIFATSLLYGMEIWFPLQQSNSVVSDDIIKAGMEKKITIGSSGKVFAIHSTPQGLSCCPIILLQDFPRDVRSVGPAFFNGRDTIGIKFDDGTIRIWITSKIIERK